MCVLRLDYENETLVWAMLSSTTSGWSKIALQTENKGCKHCVILPNTPNLPRFTFCCLFCVGRLSISRSTCVNVNESVL